MNVEHYGIIRDRLDAFISSGFVQTIIKPTLIKHSTATQIDNIYVKMRQLGKLGSGILTVDMSDYLPMFTFMGRRPPRKQAS
ncbi:hypothetical protein LSH36_320g06025 [Paralvinella palmiformis]|uniref:Uncharacterized protein n=1 Tax=Paralvinella palmiformis TaxID=53620 RepID=A0AAD9JGL6_9ANNE|nr:hypothetical protein LSH36_320g06025 [Paralvinella palmiformis]